MDPHSGTNRSCFGTDYLSVYIYCNYIILYIHLINIHCLFWMFWGVEEDGTETMNFSDKRQERSCCCVEFWLPSCIYVLYYQTIYSLHIHHLQSIHLQSIIKDAPPACLRQTNLYCRPIQGTQRPCGFKIRRFSVSFQAEQPSQVVALSS